MKNAQILILAFALSLCAQEIKLPVELDKLAAKADETVNVTLDGPMLKLAGRFLSEKSEDEATARKVVSSLQSIMVRTFEFSREGQYDPADLDSIRAQVKSAPWSRVVGVTSKRDGDNVEVYFKDGGNGTLSGMLVICAEPRDLAIVSVVGKLDPSDLAYLGGQFGIPKLDFGISIHRKGGEK